MRPAFDYAPGKNRGKTLASRDFYFAFLLLIANFARRYGLAFRHRRISLKFNLFTSHLTPKDLKLNLCLTATMRRIGTHSAKEPKNF
ncbi:MAG: hypothetical protein UHP27_01115 [Muribaculaceae bacterium]|nr:hypothetical protein [Muribaculaceae bacterium]